MDRMRNRTRLSRAALLAALILVILSQTTCNNPVDLLGEFKVEVMKAHDRYLQVLSINAPLSDGEFSPTGTIEIQFDRPIDVTTANPGTIVIRDGSGTAIDYPAKGITYVALSRMIRIRVYPYLPVDEDISISVSGVLGEDGTTIAEPGTLNFRTQNILAGSIVSLTGNDPTSSPGYTKTPWVDFSFQVNAMYRYFKYRISLDGGKTWTTAFPYSYVDRNALDEGLYLKTKFDLENIGITENGVLNLTFQFLGDDDGAGDPVEGLTDSASITYDSIPPNAPGSPDLSADDDTGISSSDNITARSDGITLSGTAPANTPVQIKSGSTVLARTTADAIGLWTADIDLDSGSWTIQATASDEAGNVSAASGALTLTVDTENLAVSTPALDAADDSGASSSDGITYRTTGLTFSGTAEAGSAVSLLEGAATLASVTADSTGHWATDIALVQGSHSLFARSSDTAGNTAESGTLAVTVDTAVTASSAPDLAVDDDTGASSADNITKLVSGLTVSGTTEAGATVVLSDGSDTLATVTASGDGIWTAELSLSAGTRTIAAQVTDAAGNSLATDSLTILVDPAISTPSVPDLSAGDDTGASTTDNITRNTSGLTFSGTADPGDLVTLLHNATGLGSVTTDGSGHWSLDLSIATGTWSVRAEASDPAGNTASSAAAAVTIDTSASVPTAPALSSADDTGVSGADCITAKTSSLTFTGTVEGGASVALKSGSNVLASTTADAAGGWTADIDLSEGSWSLTASMTDLAGNSATSAARTVTIDTSISVPAAPDLLAADDTGASQTDNITARNTGLTLQGETEGGADVGLYQGTNRIGSATAGADGSWSVDLTVADGTWALGVTVTDAAGNSASSSTNLSVTVDTAISAPSIPDLSDSDDTGVSVSDNLTKNTDALTFFGNADPLVTIQLRDGDTDLGTAVNAAPGGSWSVDLSLAAGTWNVTAMATDLAGNSAGSAAALAVTVDTAVTVNTVPDLAAADDTGSSATDNNTRTTQGLSFSGTTEAGASVRILDGSNELYSTTASSLGSWTAERDLAPGSHALSASVTDRAGNAGISSALDLVIDTDTVQPSIPDLADEDDSGVSSTDNLTRKSTGLTFTGSSEPYATIELYSAGTLLGSSSASAGGTWSVDLDLTDGERLIVAVATDPAGNSASSAGSLDLTIVEPMKPTSDLDLAAADDTGASDEDNITMTTSGLSFSGTANPFATLRIYNGTTLLATLTVGEDGSWMQDIDLAPGAWSLSAVATDSTGDSIPSDRNLELLIDTSITAPSSPDLASEDDSGIATDDNLTRNTTALTFSGTAEPLSGIRILGNGADLLGSTTATDEGNWTIDLALSGGSWTISASSTDRAGNTASSADALALTIDTDITAPSVPNLDSADDTGISSSDNITQLDSSLTFAGTADPGTTVRLYSGATLLGSATTGPGGLWSVDLALGEGAWSITARASDTAGNTADSDGSLTVTVDTSILVPSAPDLASEDDTGNSASDNITATAAGLTLSGTAEAGSTVDILEGSSALGTTTATGAGTWSIELSAGDGTRSLTAVSTDLAGNTASSLSPLVLTIDTAIALPSIPDLSANDDTGVSSIDDITRQTADLSFSGTAEEYATVRLYDGSTLLAETAAEQSGVWAMDLDLEAGIWNLTARATDAAGNTADSAGGLVLTVDTDIANPSSPDLAAEDDTGISASDNITNSTSYLSFSGTGPAGETIILLDGSEPLGTTTATAGGTWTTDLELGEGTWNISVRANDAAGNEALSAGSLAIVIDTSISDPSVADLAAEDDTGASDSDNITKNTEALTLSGTADPGTTIQLYSGGSFLGSTGTSAGGFWSMDITLPAGSAYVSTVSTDTAGNSRTSAAYLSIAVDTDTQTPSTPDLAAADDTGFNSGDNLTYYTTGLSLSGQAEGYAAVAIYTGSTLRGSTTASAAGAWAVDIALPAGSYSITATATDTAGNTATSGTLPVTVDTSLGATSIPDLAAADDSGTSSADNLTRQTSALTFSGSCDPTAVVVYLYNGTTYLGGTEAVTTGTWTVDLALGAGSYSIYAVCYDYAGNSNQTSAVGVTIDTTTTVSAPDLLAADDTGYSSTDNLTCLTSGLTFSGTSEASATVYIYNGSTLLATTAATASGTWSQDLALSAGAYSIRAVALDAAGNSASSGYLGVTVDTSLGASSVPDLAAADDTGYYSTDNTTNLTTGLTFSGTCDPTAYVVYLCNNGGALTYTTAVTSGSWTIDVSLAAGSYSISAITDDFAGNRTATTAIAVTVDTTAPGIPPVPQPATPTASRTVTWTWSSNGGCGYYQYYSTTVGGWTATTATSFTATGLVDGAYTVYVMEMDAAGNWSGYAGTTVSVNAPPNAPSVSGTTPTLDATPVWSWAAGGYGNGIFRFQLDSTTGTWTSTTATSYTASTLADGNHTLYVEEEDSGGEWSAYGYKTIRVTCLLPYNGQTGVSRTPTISWRDSLLSTTNSLYASLDGTNFTTVYTGPDNTYTYTSVLSASTRYYIYATSTGKSGTVRSPASGSYSFVTGTK